MASSFTHLHLHTEYSMLDGAARVDDVIAAARADGQPAIGITDHGNMYGVLDFYKAANKAGIKPIIGTEAYMAGESRLERPIRRGRLDDGDQGEGEKLYYHLTLLAETTAGYRNLMKLSSRAYLEGYYYKPRLDWELLEELHEGIIATTGCLGGQVLQSLLKGDDQGALEKAARLQDIFGRDNLFVEIQDHGIRAQHETNPKLIEIAKKIKAPLLATNDSHYTHREDHVAHDALLCVQTAALISDPKRFKFEGDQHYLKSAAEMRQLFRHWESACDNTLWIAERAQVEIEFGRTELPDFPLPAGFANDRDYLRHLVYEGAAQRYGHIDDNVRERIDFELGVIDNMGFNAYFLVVWDLIKFARDEKIRVGPGRGSAAGSAVSYCLRIVDLDPIRYDLLFERFLNPGRKQMPDIDMDFDDRYRSRMIEYASKRYGWDRVAQIVTFSTIKARAAVRDAARVLGYPYGLGDRVAKAMPPLVMGRDTPLYACLTPHPKYEDGYKMATDLRAMYESDSDVRQVVDVAKGLEGLRRGDGIHAAAVVITRHALTEYLPIQRKPEPGGKIDDAPIVTQYEMHGVEELGLLKMDFLGLRNLSVIDRALELIEASQGITVDIDNVNLDDEKTYEMLKRGDSIGVFQLEGGPMRALMRSLEPTVFGDIAALVALYRPGPMAANMHNDFADVKNGRKPLTYFHPDAEEVLKDTYGLMIYQESMMRVAQKFAGYSLEQADNLRKAAGKKIREVMAKERQSFEDGCEATGYGRELGKKIFDIIEPFADYAFNKSHSYGYGFISYQTAYLKANYPAEYLAALLTSSRDDKDKTAVYLAEARNSNITVTVPDVNFSLSDFATTIRDGQPTILFGMSAVRNVGEGIVHPIVAERQANGPYTDFLDFCFRVEPTVLNKRAIESLIKGGGFDSLGHARRALMLVHEEIVDLAIQDYRDRNNPQISMFDMLAGESDSGSGAMDGSRRADAERILSAIANSPSGSEWPKDERLRFEKEMLGLYVSDHPLLGAQASLRKAADCSIRELKEGGVGKAEGGGRDGAPTKTVGGVITGLTKKYTKKGELMAVFTLEDLESAIEVMVFPKTMSEIGYMIADDAIVLIRARVDDRDDVPKLIAMDIKRLEVSQDGAGPPVRIKLPERGLRPEVLNELREILRNYPGESEVYIHFGQQVLRLSGDFHVEASTRLFSEIRVLLGPDSVVV
jgi:DNA polymerase III subunit alpha